MKKELFDELVASIKEAGKIHRGEAKPSRVFVFEPEDVRTIRQKLQKSQSQFAQMIGVSIGTLQNWEQGRRQPEGPARALLVVASKAPKIVAQALAGAARRAPNSSQQPTRGRTLARRSRASRFAGSRVKSSGT